MDDDPSGNPWFECTPPGKVVGYNDDDDNENAIPDREEGGPLLRNGTPLFDDETELAWVHYQNHGLNLTGYTLSLEQSDCQQKLTLWSSGAKQPLASTTFTIGVDTFPRQVFVEGYDLGMEPLELVMKDPSGHEVASDCVMFTVARADADNDADNTGTIEGTEYEDRQELVDPGQIILVNDDDDNGNGLADKDEVDASGYPSVYANPDDDLARVGLALYVPSYAVMEGWKLELTCSAGLRMWGDQRRNIPTGTSVYNLAHTLYVWTVAPGTTLDPFPPEVYVEGLSAGRQWVNWALVSPLGLVAHKDTIPITVVKLDLTAYRPQTEGPGYGAPFARTAVPETLEETPGAGIRRNADHDNGVPTMPDYEVNTVPQENDLIEVGVNLGSGAASAIAFALERSTADIALWHYASKGNELPFVANKAAVSQSQSVWAEWVTPGTGAGACDLTLGVWDTTHNHRALTDTVHFYPFQSIVIALGGEDQVPSDPPNANHGTFQVAQFLYRQGYDVHMYDEDVVDGTEGNVGAGEAYDEVLDATNLRGAGQIAIFGYSHGGGSTYDLTWRLVTMEDMSIDFTSYVDAVMNSSFFDMRAETRRPLGTAYHMNQFQHGVTDLGDPFFDLGLDGAPVPGADWELDVETTGWGTNATHGTVDDLAEVRGAIQDRLMARVSR